MADTLTAIRLGYGGTIILDGTNVLATSGSMDNTVTPAYTSGYSQPTSEVSRSRILHADGTVSHSGSIGFDMTFTALSAVKNILKRNATFSVGMYDGEYGMEMDNCYASSITLSGSPSGFITGSISFQSATPPTKSLGGSSNLRDSLIADVIPYWWSGNSYVRDWTFTFNQQITPRYANKNSYLMQSEGILASSPLYIFVGEIDCTLDFTTFVPLVTDTVNIANSSFRIIGRTASTGYAIGGQNDLGTYKYSIVSHALGYNNGGMLTIT